MTWHQIKAAVDKLGIAENDEIIGIKCEQENGTHTLHRIKIGNFVILAEDLSDKAAKEALGCCC